MIVQGQTPRSMSRLAFWSVIGLGALLLPLLPIPAQQSGGSQADDEIVANAPQAPAPGSDAEQEQPARPPRRLDPRQPVGVDRSEQLEAARDEVELAKAKVRIRQAELEEVRARVRQAQRNVDRLNQAYQKGVVQESAVIAAQNEAELLPAQVRTKEAEVQEAEIHLKQATRRLQRLADEDKKSDMPPTGAMGGAMGRPGMAPAPMGGAMQSGSRPPMGGGSMSGPGPGMAPMGPGMRGMGKMGGGGPGTMGSAAGGKMGAMPGMMMGGGSPAGGPPASSASGLPEGGGMKMGMMGASGGRSMMGIMGGGGSGTMTASTSEGALGYVMETDPKTGLVAISIGTDSGIRTGSQLEVYRLKPNPKYLGKLEIIQVKENRAVGRPVGGARGLIETDDLVAGRVIGTSGGTATSAGEALPSAGTSGGEESQARIQELERKVDQLMKQIDALRDDLKQRSGKGPRGALGK